MFRARTIATFLSLCMLCTAQWAYGGVIIQEADFETMASASSSLPVDSPVPLPAIDRRSHESGESLSGNGSSPSQNLVAAAMQLDPSPAEPPSIGRVFRRIVILVRSIDEDCVYRPPEDQIARM